MMTRKNEDNTLMLALVCAVFCSLLPAGETTMQCVDGTIVGMASPALMTGGGDIRRTYGRGYLMTHAVFTATCCGVVKQWSFNVARTARFKPLTLQVWRPLGQRDPGFQQGVASASSSASAGRMRYRLMGKTNVTAGIRNRRRRNFDSDDRDDRSDDDDNGDGYYYSYTDGKDGDDGHYYSDDVEEDHDDDDDDDDDDGEGSKVVTVALSERQRLSVQAGDVIGWRSSTGDVISYTPRYYNLDNVVINEMREVGVGEDHEFPSTLRSHRTYGIHAVLTAGSPPVITNLPAKVEIRYDIEDGTFVFNVTAHDVNLGDELAFVLHNSDEDNDDDDLPFVIDVSSGTLIVQGKLSPSSYDVRVSVTDPCGLYDVETLTVVVTSSTSPPVFTLQEMLTVPVRGGSVEYSHKIVMNDDGEDDVICHISDVTPSGFFFSVTGRTRLQIKGDDVKLEESQKMTYKVGVTCGNDALNATTMVTVTLFCYDPPAFLNSSATIRVSSRSSNIGDVVYTIEVTSNEAFPVTFRQNECHCPFYLYPDGSVALTRSLMSEPVTSYALDAYVSDGVSTIGPSTLHFIIADINRPPQFVDLPLSVAVEEHSTGVVLRMQVTDADGDDVRVSVLWAPEEAGNFFRFIERVRTLQVKPSASLDYEYMKVSGLTQMTATFTASDGFKTSSADIIITINDVNEPPLCSQTSFFLTVGEGKKGTIASDGTYLTSSCHDPESHPLRYSIHQPSPHPNVTFLIHPYDATLTYTSSINVKTATILTSFMVKVCDVGELCVGVAVEVEILDVPNRPKMKNLPRMMFVSEDVEPGQLLFVVHVVVDEDDEVLDEDAQEIAKDVNIFFRVLLGDPGLFEIRGRALHLKQTRHFDFEMSPMHIVELVAETGHMMSDPATLTLDIIDVNEAPVWSVDHINVTAEEGEAGAIILSTLHQIVMDQDINDTLTFSLLHHSNLFTIHPTSAIISLAADYDVDYDVMPRELTLTVKVVDSWQLSSTIQVHIVFLNKNENPKLVNLPREITVPEDVGKGRVIYRVIAEDPDGDEVVIHMSAADGKGNFFHFNETDGTLTLKEGKSLDFETTSIHILRFTADDGALTSPPMMLTVLIDDVNEAPYFTRPVFYISAAEGRAGTNIGSRALSSSAQDPDGDHLVFHLLPASQSSGFSIDTETAELSFTSDFVLSRQSSPVIVNLTLCVTDPGGLTAEAQVVVTIYDVNVSPRLLYLPVNVTVPQNTPEGALLYTVYAEDDDDTLLFRMNALTVDWKQLFDINSSTGEIHLTNRPALHTNQTAYFPLQVSVTDGLLSSDAAILGVLFTPDLTSPGMPSTPYVINVREDELGFFISMPDELFRTESASLESASYHISGGSGQAYFRIDSRTGNLLFTGNGERSNQQTPSMFTIDITLNNEKDLRQNWTKSVKINIIDVNDHAPEVTSDLLTWFVSKRSQKGTVIGRIEARDLDKGENARLTFEVVAAALPENTFKITADGEVKVNRPLNTLTVAHTSIQVTVSDCGQPPLSTSVVVFVVFT